MSCLSRSRDIEWPSTADAESSEMPGVRYTIRQVSLERRASLIRSIREVAKRVEFHQASDSLEEKLEASALALEIDAAYLRWGLIEIHGLAIDGEAATCESLIERGPESLVREIVAHIKRQCSLTDEERKN